MEYIKQLYSIENSKLARNNINNSPASTDSTVKLFQTIVGNKLDLIKSSSEHEEYLYDKSLTHIAELETLQNRNHTIFLLIMRFQ